MSILTVFKAIIFKILILVDVILRKIYKRTKQIIYKALIFLNELSSERLSLIT